MRMDGFPNAIKKELASFTNSCDLSVLMDSSKPYDSDHKTNTTKPLFLLAVYPDEIPTLKRQPHHPVI